MTTTTCEIDRETEAQKEIATDLFQTSEVRRIMREGEPWWFAADVCAVLGIQSVSLAVNGRADRDDGLEDDEKLRLTLPMSGQNRQVYLVNEPGLYRLILRSRNPASKTFKRWITHEVLPSIRKTGSYSVQLAESREVLVARALIASNQILQEQKTLIQELAPKAASFDRFLSADNNRLLSLVAKDLVLKPNKLFKTLRLEGVLYIRDGVSVAAQQYVDAGYFTHRTTTYTDSEGTTQNRTQLLVTPRGQTWLARRYGGRVDLSP